MLRPERRNWKDSNLALIGSDLDHKIKAAAAEGETAWEGCGQAEGKKVWRVEQFKIVAWPEEKYGKFHTGDSYIVLNSYKEGDSDALLHDVHIWIGKESSQDEYGTAAYKMVELDDFLGGAAVQHREVQGSESPMFLSYFDGLTYLDGGVDTGFTHVEPSKDQPHLYKIKGTEKGLSMTQVPLSKSSMNEGDSFILFANPSLVWVWHGASANPDEKAKANQQSESLCTEGTAVVLESGDDSQPDFWAYLGDGEIAAAEAGDEAVSEFKPILFRVPAEGDCEQIAEAEPVKVRFGRPENKLEKSLLDEGDVFLLDAGWECFLWMGKESDKSEKLAGMSKADKYMNSTGKSVLPLTVVKSGFESSSFNAYFT